MKKKFHIQRLLPTLDPWLPFVIHRKRGKADYDVNLV